MTQRRQTDPNDYETLLRLMRARHTTRAFRPEPVPREDIQRMLEAAQLVASWHNVQPWQGIVTSGESTERFRAALLEAARTSEVNSDLPQPEEYLGVYKDRRRTAGYGLYESLGIERSDFEARNAQTLENFRLFGAPHVLIIHSASALGPYGVLDCGAYISMVLLAAESLGLAAAPQAAIAMQSRLVHEHFGIPADRVVVAGVSFGFESDHVVNAFRTERASISEAVSWLD